MFHPVAAETADEAWLRLADLLRSGRQRSQASRAGPTHEVLRTAVSIADPRQRWVASRVPALNPAFAVAELLWTLAGRNDSGFVNFFNRQLPKYAGEGPTYYGAYGPRLRSLDGVDQLRRAASTLRMNPDSRQVVLQIWDSRHDLPYDDGEPRSKDVPCNIFAMLKVRDGALEWTQVTRSQDLVLGFTYDVAVFTMLHEILAGWAQKALGTFNLLSDSLHVYETDLSSLVSKSQVVLPPVTHSLSIPMSESESAIGRMNALADQMVNGDLSGEHAEKAIAHASLPTAYDSLLRVLIADGLRRAQHGHAAERVMTGCCCNPLRVMWSRWCAARGDSRTAPES